MKKIGSGLALWLFGVSLWGGGNTLAIAANDIVFLEQGWDEATRESMSFLSFGSRIVPYTWFLALEQADSPKLLRSDDFLGKLGFIAATASKHNPDGLPIGITRDGEGEAAQVGLTCAACHTGQLHIGGRLVRIEGSQALIDYSGFEQAIFHSLQATLDDPQKFSRFLSRLHNNQETVATQEARLRTAIQQRIARFRFRFAINETAVPYGHGRLDAFGQIFNAISAEALNLLDNRNSPNAPTSFPVLWDASHLDLVQWNGSAPNKEPGPLFQNAITALAVYGEVHIDPQRRTYESSIRIENLAELQKGFYRLTAPRWPAKLAGPIDEEKARAGAVLYERHCSECHQRVDPTDKKRKLRAVLTPLEEVGTDRLMADNFNQLRVSSATLKGKKKLVFFGEELKAQLPPLDMVLHTVTATLLNRPWETVKAISNEYQSNYPAPEQRLYNQYKARPINGIWASAPYLHNGSVPSIYDLLLPPPQRPKTFWVGNFAFDPIRLGHGDAAGEGASLLDTRLPGNSNAGHEYGTRLSDDERWQLVEFIKTL